MLVLSRSIACVSALVVLTAASVALAALGHPTPWQTGFQDAGSPVMENIIWFHRLLLIVITLIAAFVLALLVWVMVRFNQRAHPTPSRTTHRTSLEVAWTVIPIAILVFIAVPSFGIKIDAIPGRLNETWFKATKEGIYYGQCSELCGKNHAYMPIAVRVVSDSDFNAWLEDAKKKYARGDDSLPRALAARESAKAE